MTHLKKPVVRRIGRLVVRLDESGVSIRGFRKHSWRVVEWARLASLFEEGHDDLVRHIENRVGEKVLKEIGAIGQRQKQAEPSRGSDRLRDEIDYNWTDDTFEVRQAVRMYTDGLSAGLSSGA